MTLTLFELTGQYRDLQSLVDSDEVPEQVIRDTLEGLTGEFNDKAVAVAHVVLNLQAASAAMNDAAAAMKARATRVQARADSLRHYLLYCMQSADVKRIERPDVLIKRVMNPPAVQVTDEDAIPRDYFVQPPPPPPRLDRKALAAALKAGEPVPGAYIEQGERVEIRL
jgi:Siphovirus Gp157